MANKRNSKTARVLNLITQTDAETPETAAAQPVPKPDAKPAPTAAELSPAALADAAPDKPAKADETAATSETKPARTKSTRSRTTKKKARVSTPPEETDGNSAEAGLQPTSSPDVSPLPPAPQPVVPIVQDVRAKEQEISEEIRTALEQEAAKLMPPEAEPPTVKPIPHEPKAAPQHTISDLQPASDVQASPADSGVSAEIPAEIYTPHGERDVHYTNVLQALVEEQSPYYISHMLQCTCPRCVADMKACALTNLPSKYVVLSASQSQAYMSVYAARYERELSVQMMRACVVVNENPHH